jgi:hypothetical protein
VRAGLPAVAEAGSLAVGHAATQGRAAQTCPARSSFQEDLPRHHSVVLSGQGVPTKGPPHATRVHSRLGGHIRRHGVAYAAMAVAVSFSPVPSMAADLVTTAEIKNRAITGQKLGANSVSSAKVANGTIRGADVRDQRHQH